MLANLKQKYVEEKIKNLEFKIPGHSEMSSKDRDMVSS
jgi:hypothetical protein